MRLRPIKVEGSDAWAKLYQRAHATLIARIEEFDPPELKSIPVQDKVLVYRFPNRAAATQTAGGLIIPETSRKEEVDFASGVLMYAGAEAMDVLASHGILVGDIVRWAYLAGDEEDVRRVDEAIENARSLGLTGARLEAKAIEARNQEMSKKKLIRLRTSDIHESVDLLERLYGEKPTMEYVREERPDGFTHVIRPIADNL